MGIRTQQAKRALVGSVAAIGVLLGGALCGVQLERYILNHLSLPEFAAYGAYSPYGTYSVKDIAPGIVTAFDLWHPTCLYPIACFVATAVILLLAFRNPRAKVWRVAAIAVLVVDVSLPYRTVYGNPDTSDLYKSAPPDIDFIRNHGFDVTRDRVYPVDFRTALTYPLLNLFRRIPVINDYGPMWSKRYQAVTGFFSNGSSESAIFSPALMDAVSVKFLVAHDQRIAHQLRWIQRGPPGAKSVLPLPALNCVALACVNAQFSEGGVITFGAVEGLSIIQVPFEPEPNTTYEVSFDGRSPAVSIGPFHIDLYSNHPEWEGFGLAQRYSILSFGPTFTKMSVLINSAHTSVKQGYIRLYTTAVGPYEIRNLAITKSGPAPTAYKEVFGAANGNIVFENPSALPRFRFASELIPAGTVSEARAIVMSSSFDPASQVTVEGLSNPMRVESGTILSQSIENNSMMWRVETGPNAFFVVADSWFPGWTAMIDGRAESIRIVDGLLRGVFVTGAGQHVIQMEFRPSSVRYGLIATIAGGLLVAGLALTSAGGKRGPARRVA